MKTETVIALAVLAALALAKGKPVAQAVISTIRGIRNNNPGNIERTGTKWVGMAEDQPDPRFIKFAKPEYGIRAMVRILKNDYLEGQRTIRSLINEWAPPVENNTSAYVAAVSKALGISPDAPFDVLAKMPQLVAAIIKHENGVQPYGAEIIASGIRLEKAA